MVKYLAFTVYRTPRSFQSPNRNVNLDCIPLNNEPLTANLGVNIVFEEVDGEDSCFWSLQLGLESQIQTTGRFITFSVLFLCLKKFFFGKWVFTYPQKLTLSISNSIIAKVTSVSWNTESYCFKEIGRKRLLCNLEYPCKAQFSTLSRWGGKGLYYRGYCLTSLLK